MLALSRDLGTQYKTAFVLAHKIGKRWLPRSGAARSAARASGPRSMAAISAATSSPPIAVRTAGSPAAAEPVRQAQGRRRDPRARRQDAAGRVPQRSRCAQLHPPAGSRSETELYADEAGSWNELHARYTLHRINHQEAYSLATGAGRTRTTPNASSLRMRRGEIGHHHHVAGPYLIRFAQEAAWREDHRKEPNGVPG